MATMTRAQRRESHARWRRLRRYRERPQQELRRARRYPQALEQALADVALPKTLATALEWRRQAQEELLGKIIGTMFPPYLGAEWPMS